MSRTDFLLPVGRIVQGSLYNGNTTNDKGEPLLVKTGANKGQPRTEFYFAVAVPKTPGHTHWAQTEWGAKIYGAGAAASPALYQSRAFSWKIEDGDSTEPNKRGKRPCDQQGFPGNWIVKMSGGYAPRVFQRDAAGNYQQMTDAIVKLGHYVQASGDASGNNSAESPGVYLNHQMVLFVGYGPEIVVGPDAASVFGAGPAGLPAGVSAVPLGVAAMPVAAPAMPAMPAMPAVAPVVVTPNPAFLAPTVPPALPVPVVPTAPAGPVPTAKLIASGFTAEKMMSSGWTLDTLKQHGYIA